jgi:hypothetical protein
MMVDELLFCYENWHTIRMLLSLDQIQGWITSRMKKKTDAERGVLTDEALQENSLVQQLDNPEDTIDVNSN